MPHEIIALISPALFAVLWYLLKQKDDKQAKEIALLFKKHDDDAEELKALRLQIAENHYKRVELDARFDKLDGTIKTSFDSLGCKLEKLSDALLSHMTVETAAENNRRMSTDKQG